MLQQGVVVLEVVAPCPCLEDTEDNLDKCVELDEVIHWLVEEDLFGTVGVGIGFYRQPGSLPLDSRVWQVRDAVQSMWKPYE